jgi:hypothetical protein
VHSQWYLPLTLIVLTIGIRPLIKAGVTHFERADLRIAVPASNFEQPGIATISVARSDSEKENYRS